jgi:hypothetical protein
VIHCNKCNSYYSCYTNWKGHTVKNKVWDVSRYYPRTCLVGLGKTWKTLTSVPLKIQSTNQIQIRYAALSFWMILGQVNFMENSPSWVLKVPQPIKTFLTFMEPKGSSQCSQQAATRSCSEPYESNLHHHTCFIIMHFNIILPAKSMSVCIRFSDYSFVCTYHLSHAYYMSHSSQTPWFDHPKNMWWKVQIMKISIRFKVYLTFNSYGMSV